MSALSLLVEIFLALLRISAQASVVIGLVLLAQWVFREKLSPRWRYTLWIIVLIRLALPILPGSPFSIFNYTENVSLLGHRRSLAEAALLGSPEPQTTVSLAAPPPALDAAAASRWNTQAPSAGLDPGAKTASSANGLSANQQNAGKAVRAPFNADPKTPGSETSRYRSTLSPLYGCLSLVWLGGALFLAARILSFPRRLNAELAQHEAATAPAVFEILEQSKRLIGINRVLPIIQSRAVKSPALLGFIRPWLLLPEGMGERFTARELRLVFLHELAHLKRRDIAVNWLITVLQVVHWFNPLVWLAFSRIRADRELACDELALSHAPEADRPAYGQAMIKLLESFARPTAIAGLVGILEDKQQMKRRIGMMTQFNRATRWSKVIPLGLAFSLGIVGLTDALTNEQRNEPTPERTVSAVVVRQVWAPAQDTGGTISADGRYLSFSDPDSGDVAIRDLTTGKNRRLTNKGSWDKSNEFADENVFAPDGKRLAYSWYDGEKFFELRTISLDDPQPRVLVKNNSFDVWDWSPDGKSIVATSWADYQTKGSQLLLVSADDGAMRMIKSFRGSGPSNAKFSPDGRFLAVSYRIDKSEDIALLSIENGTEIPLVQHPAEDSVVGWTPDGTTVLFVSNRRGAKDLWGIEVEEGRAKGLPVLLKADFGDVHVLGISHHGQLWYGVSRHSDNAMAVVDIDFATGKTKSGLRQIAHPASHVLHGMALSANGRYLAFAATDRHTPKGKKLFVLDLETRIQREVTDPVHLGNPVHLGRWLADNRTIFRRIRASGGREELSLLDVERGEVTELGGDEHGPWPGIGRTGNFMFNSTEQALVYVCWSSKQKVFMAKRRNLRTGDTSETVVATAPEPDEEYNFDITSDLRTVFFSANPKKRSPERPSRIFRCDLETGTASEWMRSTNYLGVFPSPNPSRIAVAEAPTYWERNLRLYSLEANPPRELWTAHVPPPVVVYGWTPDGQYLICRGPGTDDHTAKVEPAHITLVSASGQVTRTEVKIPQMGYIAAVHPHAGQIFMILREPPVREIWVMEKFLPEPKRASR